MDEQASIFSWRQVMSLKTYSAWKLSSELIILLKRNPAGLNMKEIIKRALKESDSK